MEAQQEKIADEAKRDGNVDAWLNSMTDELMEDALKFFRQGYLTSLGSNAKTMSTSEVYE